jgi:hypothetical protein
MMADQSPSDGFVANSLMLKEIFSATNLKELFTGATSSLKKIFQAQRVNFLVVDKEVLSIFRKEEGQLTQIHHAHTNFNLVVPDGFNLARNEYKFIPGFKNMNDVNKGNCVAGRYCVWPIHNLRNPTQIMMYVQIDYKQGSPHSFDRQRDSKAMQIISSIIANIIERVGVFTKIEAAQFRAF